MKIHRTRRDGNRHGHGPPLNHNLKSMAVLLFRRCPKASPSSSSGQYYKEGLKIGSWQDVHSRFPLQEGTEHVSLANVCRFRSVLSAVKYFAENNNLEVDILLIRSLFRCLCFATLRNINPRKSKLIQM